MKTSIVPLSKKQKKKKKAAKKAAAPTSLQVEELPKEIVVPIVVEAAVQYSIEKV